jgi:hypothetical protein
MSGQIPASRAELLELTVILPSLHRPERARAGSNGGMPPAYGGGGGIPGVPGEGGRSGAPAAA